MIRDNLVNEENDCISLQTFQINQSLPKYLIKCLVFEFYWEPWSTKRETANQVKNMEEEDVEYIMESHNK